MSFILRRGHAFYSEGVIMNLGRVLVIIWDRVFNIVEGLGRLQFKGTKNVSDILLSMRHEYNLFKVQNLSFHCLLARGVQSESIRSIF